MTTGVLVDVSLALVARKGADGVALVVTMVVAGQDPVEMEFIPEVADKHRFPDPQARSVGQQPPPRLTGQAWSPQGQLKVVCKEVFVSVGVRLLVVVVVVVVVVIVVLDIAVEVVVDVWTGRTTEVTTTVVGDDEETTCVTVATTVTGRGTPDLAMHISINQILHEL
jgi:hypothetical protein